MAMPDAYVWTLLVFAVTTVLAGLALRRRQPEAGLVVALVGSVMGLFTLGFVAGHFV